MIPTEKQAAALQIVPGCEMLFEGARGAVGTCYLMLTLAQQERLYGDRVHGILVSRTAPELMNLYRTFIDFFQNSPQVFESPQVSEVFDGAFPSGAAFRFPSGATIRFAVIDDVEEACLYLANEHTFIGVDTDRVARRRPLLRAAQDPKQTFDSGLCSGDRDARARGQ